MRKIRILDYTQEGKFFLVDVYEDMSIEQVSTDMTFAEALQFSVLFVPGITIPDERVKKGLGRLFRELAIIERQ